MQFVFIKVREKYLYNFGVVMLEIMKPIGKSVKMALANEDSLGRVLVGSTGKGIKTIAKEAASSGETKSQVFKNIVNLTEQEVKRFDEAQSLASDVFNKKAIGKDLYKSIKKDGKTAKSFSNKMVELYDAAKSGDLDGSKINKIFGKELSNADDLAKAALKSVKKEAAEEAAEGAVKVATKSGIKGIFSKAGNFLKNKGGTIAIFLNIAFELPELIKGFKNGDGLQQVGRSSFNIAGCAAGAAAGAAIGSVLPIAGTAIGGIIGGLCGIAGSMIGATVANKAGNAIFGKSIADQKAESAEVAETEAAQTQQYSPEEMQAIQQQLLMAQMQQSQPIQNNLSPFGLSTYA